MAINVGGEAEGEVMSDINVTPLVDVMLVLLIIFIITVPVIIQQVNLKLPIATNVPTQTKPENVTIAIDEQGNIYWNTKKLASFDELKNSLRGIVRQEPQPEVHIRPNKLVEYKAVAQVLASAQRLGVTKLGMVGNEQFVK